MATGPSLAQYQNPVRSRDQMYGPRLDCAIKPPQHDAPAAAVLMAFASLSPPGLHADIYWAIATPPRINSQTYRRSQP